MKVWEKIPRRLAQSKGWKINETRWFDINKGDDDDPVYRSRLVGKEFNNETWTAYSPELLHWKPCET